MNGWIKKDQLHGMLTLELLSRLLDFWNDIEILHGQIPRGS